MTTKLLEAFEPKTGDEELCARLLNITDQDKICLFYNILGAYTGSTHAEWQNFKDKLERFLPRYELKEVLEKYPHPKDKENPTSQEKNALVLFLREYLKVKQNNRSKVGK